MKKIVFISVPAHGHINPTVAIVKELVKKNVQVIYYATEKFRQILEMAGAEYRGYRAERIDRLDAGGVKGMSQKQIASEFTICGTDIVSNHLEEVIAEKPDCLIYDSMALWGIAFERALKIPSVASITTFAMNGKVSIEMLKSAGLKSKLHFMGLLGTILRPDKRMGDAIAGFTGGESRSGRNLLNVSAGLKLVYTTRRLQPHEKSFDETYKFVGPSIGERNEQFKLPPDERPLIFISLGTVAYNPKFFQAVYKAFGDGKYRVVLSAGTASTEQDLQDTPANFIVKSFVPQLEVLKQAALFVSHCGMNSAHEAIFHGVPIIGIPQTGEQSLVASRVEKEGTGIYLRRMSAKKLRAAAEKILSDKSYRENCLCLHEGFKEAGGAARAAELILEVAGVRESAVNMS